MSFGRRGVKDITGEFVSASDRLEPGQLVKDEFFTLFEAVGALEVCQNDFSNVFFEDIGLLLASIVFVC